jgi:methylated-DNA-[protein]-cysteine S-methyltransferase
MIDLTMRYTQVATSIGSILLAGDGNGLQVARLPRSGSAEAMPLPDWRPDYAGLLAPAAAFVDTYFQGTPPRIGANLRLAPHGTAFQQAVWMAILEIPWGKTRTYGEIARSIGRPHAARAVGAAAGANPLPLFVPCHRVIGCQGALTGFTGGLAIKKWLLDHERGILVLGSSVAGV